MGRALSRIATNSLKGHAKVGAVKKNLKNRAQSGGGAACVPEPAAACEPVVKRYYPEEDVAGDVLNADAWQDGAVLQIGDLKYKVERNPPAFTEPQLPNYIMAGFPVCPKLSLEFGDSASSLFRWYKEVKPGAAEPGDGDLESSSGPGPSSAWIETGVAERVYTPCNADIGLRLKLHCTPGNGQRFGPSCELESMCPVEAGPAPARDSQAQSVTQPDAHVIVFEGDSLELRCNYSFGGAVFLFWYMQHPGQGLQLLLRYFSGETVVHGVNGFEADFQKSNSSFHLKKASVHWSDSAVYFCALSAQGEQPPERAAELEFLSVPERAMVFLNCTFRDGGSEVQKIQTETWERPHCSFPYSPVVKKKVDSLFSSTKTAERSNGDSVTQREGLVTSTEGLPVNLNCTYEITYRNPSLFWYVQYPKKELQLLLWSITENKKTEHHGFHATLHKSSSSFHLQKSSVQLSDSALYYCALSDTVRETAGEAAHKPRMQEG
ncbi:2',5'-phosphodiesterase 12 [Lemmus lemmus]